MYGCRADRAAPGLSRLLDEIGASMAVDFDFNDEVRGLKVPTLVAFGDTDMTPPSHAVESSSCSVAGGATVAGWAKGGRRGLRARDRRRCNVFQSPVLAAAIAFLDAPRGGRSDPGPVAGDQTGASYGPDRSPQT